MDIVFSDKEQEILKSVLISVINKKHNPDLIINLSTRISKIESKIEDHPYNMMKNLLMFIISLISIMNFIFLSDIINTIIMFLILWCVTKIYLSFCAPGVPYKLIQKHKRLELLINILNGY